MFNKSNKEVRIDIPFYNEKLCGILKKASIKVANTKEKANDKTLEKRAAALKVISLSKY